MKTSSLKRLCYGTAALSLILSSGAWAQSSGNTSAPPTMVPSTVSPVQAADQAATNVASQVDPAKPVMDSSIGKEVPSPDSVLTKLKENASPVTINDMIAAQDVITRLDLISQIEDKMSKIDDARAKRLAAAAAAANPTGVNPATLPGGSLLPGQSGVPVLTNASAISALQQAMPGASSAHSSQPIAMGIAQVLAITGTNGDYSALLQLDGHQLNVKNGSTVPGVGVVSGIDSKSVTIIKPNGKTTNVAFTQN